MIYITGDTHADWYSRFCTDSFPEQKEMTRNDIVIVCGDFGIWHDDDDERERFSFLEKRPFTILFCDGNHENFDRLYSDEFEIVDFHGGKAHKIRDNIFHLMRGNIFTVENKKFFVFGGASSHDIRDGIIRLEDYPDIKTACEAYEYLWRRGYEVRAEHISWWKEEIPTEEEMDLGLKNLAESDFDVDFIITHCAPQSIASTISYGEYKRDKLTVYLDSIAEKTMFKKDGKNTKWFFGHYHDNKQIMTDYYLLYEQIIRIV